MAHLARDPWLGARARDRRRRRNASSPSVRARSATTRTASGSAEADGALVGFGIAVQREHVWYLAALHVRPAYQSRGIGAEIIRRAVGGGPPGEPADGRRGRAKSRLQRALRPVRDVPRDAAGRGVGRPVVERPGILRPGAPAPDDLAAIDRAVLGVARPEDHAFWGSVPGLHAFTVMRDDRAGRLRLRPGRRRDRPDRRPRPGRPRARRRGLDRRRGRARRDDARGSASRAPPAGRSSGCWTTAGATATGSRWS